MSRTFDFWPLVLSLATGTARKATFGEAKALARKKRAEAWLPKPKQKGRRR